MFQARIELTTSLRLCLSQLFRHMGTVADCGTTKIVQHHVTILHPYEKRCKMDLVMIYKNGKKSK